MTGPDHYGEAERLARECARLMKGMTANTAEAVLETVDTTSRIAQVHATLALTAATIDAEMSNPALDAWAEATGGAS